jgi:hypothetical protein
MVNCLVVPYICFLPSQNVVKDYINVVKVLTICFMMGQVVIAVQGWVAQNNIFTIVVLKSISALS